MVPEYSAELGRAVHVYLGKSPTALVTVQLEDMIGMLEPVNVPGTSSRIFQLDAPHDGERASRSSRARTLRESVRGHGRESPRRNG